jgi:hypothetical protein
MHQQIDLSFVIGQEILPYLKRREQVIEFQFTYCIPREGDHILEGMTTRTMYSVVKEKWGYRPLSWYSQLIETGSVSAQALEKLEEHCANHTLFDDACEPDEWSSNPFTMLSITKIY